MCRNIKTLYNFSPPATKDEIRASAIQFVRKLSGMNAPSKANEAAFNRAVDQVTKAAEELLSSLVTMAPPRDRDVEAKRPAPGMSSGSVASRPRQSPAAFRAACISSARPRPASSEPSANSTMTTISR